MVRKQKKVFTDFLNYVDLSRFNIYFKIRLYKFLQFKFPVLKNFSLLSATW